MGYLIAILMVAASIWVVGNLRAPNPAIPLLIVLWLLGIGLITGLSFTLLLCALVVAVLLLLFGSNKTRKRVLTKPLLTQFRRVLPAMSDTEAEALNAGTVWWEGELFKGRPQWSKLLKVTSPRLSAEEQEFLDGPVETLCIMLNDWHITYEAKDLPETVWQFIRGHGFFGLIIPKR